VLLLRFSPTFERRGFGLYKLQFNLLNCAGTVLYQQRKKGLGGSELSWGQITACGGGLLPKLQT